MATTTTPASISTRPTIWRRRALLAVLLAIFSASLSTTASIVPSRNIRAGARAGHCGFQIGLHLEKAIDRSIEILLLKARGQDVVDLNARLRDLLEHGLGGLG